MATTFAERGRLSSSDISPKKSPGLSSESVSSRPFSPNSATFTRPEAMTNIASPGSSCATMIVSAGRVRSCSRRARSSMRGGLQPRKIAVDASSAR